MLWDMEKLVEAKEQYEPTDITEYRSNLTDALKYMNKIEDPQTKRWMF